MLRKKRVALLLLVMAAVALTGHFAPQLFVRGPLGGAKVDPAASVVNRPVTHAAISPTKSLHVHYGVGQRETIGTFSPQTPVLLDGREATTAEVPAFVEAHPGTLLTVTSSGRMELVRP